MSTPRFAIATGVAWVDSVEGQRPGTGGGATSPEAWVAHMPDGPALSLNGPGLTIWLACEALGAATAESIAGAIRRESGYESVPLDDVRNFLAALATQGLLDQID